jgi:hypothetical protein
MVRHDQPAAPTQTNPPVTIDLVALRRSDATA